MKRLLKFLFSFLILSFFLVPQARAADLNVDCPALPVECSKTGDLLFDSTKDGFWYPGRTLTKTINLKNSSLEKRVMAIKGERILPRSVLEEVMHISIVGETGSIWSGSVTDFYGQDKIEMGIFDPGADFNYDFTVSMSRDADDDYQNKEMSFNLTLGFWGEPIPTPTPTSAPAAMVLGAAAASAPVCNDTKPGIPTNFIASPGLGAGQVSLSWTPPDPPYTYFLIAYSDNPDGFKWGNPNVGSGTSYVVSGLGSGTYYFWVRAQNGCMPGDFVGPESPGAIAGLGTGGPAIGFVEGVLGVEKEKVEGEMGGGIASAAGEVGGAKAPICPFWWIVLLGQTLFLAGFHFLGIKKPWLSALVVVLGALLDRYAHTHWYLPSKVCPYAFWLAAGLAILQTKVQGLIMPQRTSRKTRAS